MSEPAPRSFRFALFLAKLSRLAAASSHDEARLQIADTLNGVEDEFSGTPFNPAEWANDGRMYPPQDDFAFPVKGRPDVILYRTKGHRLYIRSNGAIRIENAKSRDLVIEKPGQNGKGVFDS